MRDIDDLGEVIPKVLEPKPATFESFDDATLWLASNSCPVSIRCSAGAAFINLFLSFIPTSLQLRFGVPKLVLMVEFNGETEEEVREKVRALHRQLRSTAPATR